MKKTFWNGTHPMYNALKQHEDTLVPSYGATGTIEGEILRAALRIHYRFYNDGDMFFERYGCETCGVPLAFLTDCYDIPKEVEKLACTFEENAKYEIEEVYETCLINFMKGICKFLDSRNGQTTKSNEDMFTYTSKYIERSWVDDWYEY